VKRTDWDLEGVRALSWRVTGVLLLLAGGPLVGHAVAGWEGARLTAGVLLCACGLAVLLAEADRADEDARDEEGRAP
jgi:hypothetical protein